MLGLAYSVRDTETGEVRENDTDGAREVREKSRTGKTTRTAAKAA